MRFVRGDRFTVDDPAAARLAALWQQGGAPGVLHGLFGAGGLFERHRQPSAAQRARLLQWIAAAG